MQQQQQFWNNPFSALRFTTTTSTTLPQQNNSSSICVLQQRHNGMCIVLQSKFTCLGRYFSTCNHHIDMHFGRFVLLRSWKLFFSTCLTKLRERRPGSLTYLMCAIAGDPTTFSVHLIFSKSQRFIFVRTSFSCLFRIFSNKKTCRAIEIGT